MEKVSLLFATLRICSFILFWKPVSKCYHANMLKYNGEHGKYNICKKKKVC